MADCNQKEKSSFVYTVARIWDLLVHSTAFQPQSHQQPSNNVPEILKMLCFETQWVLPGDL